MPQWRKGEAGLASPVAVVLRESGGPSTLRLLGFVIGVIVFALSVLSPLAGEGADRSCRLHFRFKFQAVDTTSRSRDAKRPKFCKSSTPNKRAQGRPGARCTRGPVCGLHKTSCTRAYRAAVNTRPSLRNGFTAYAALSPETSSWLTPSPSVQLALLRQLDACNGRQDHTVLPYA